MILHHALTLFESSFVEGEAIRFLSVSLGKLADDGGMMQLSLFEDNGRKWRRRRLLRAIDAVNGRYGKGTLRIASSFLDTSVAKRRLRFVGGHKGGDLP